MQLHPIDIVAIGASAGGVAAIANLLHALPSSLPATVLVTLHRSVTFRSQLQSVLESASNLPVVVAKQGEKLQTRKCYLGTPSLHLTVGPGLVAKLVHDGFYRAHNIDLLFSSLARNAGPRTVGVVLSGLLKDGTHGLAALKEAGGKTLVQCPSEATYKEMPRNAIALAGPVDMVAPIDQLALEICRLVHTTAARPAADATPLATVATH